MKLSYENPWQLKSPVKGGQTTSVNPILNESCTLTMGFKVEEGFRRDPKIGFYGIPGKNLGISYDYNVDTFVFEFWTKGKNGDNFHCYKDFHITDFDISNGLVITLVYNKEQMSFELYHNFEKFFNVTLDEPLIDDYIDLPLFIGAHNPGTPLIDHRCFTDMEITHFSIFNRVNVMEDVKNHFLYKIPTDDLMCYFDLDNKLLVYKETKIYNLLQNPEDEKLTRFLMKNLNSIDMVEDSSFLKINYKEPWKLNLTKLIPNKTYTNLFDTSFTMTTKFRVADYFKKDYKVGFLGVPGKNFGISYDYEVDTFVFEYWTKNGEEEDIFNCHKDFNINQEDVKKGLLITITYDKEKQRFTLFNNFNQFFIVDLENELIDNYNNQSLYFGCHNDRTVDVKHMCFTEMELSHFSFFEGVVKIQDIKKFYIQKKEEINEYTNLVYCFDFSDTIDKTVLYDKTPKKNILQRVGMPMTDFDVTKEKLNSVGCGFCLAKWTQVTMHLHNGTTHSCHHPVPHKVTLNELERNHTALHNSNVKKKARKEMLDGERPKECQYCWNVEDASDSFSDRIFKSSEPWSEPYFDEIKDLHWREDYNPKYAEISFSNTCNFKCAYCGPEYSSKWMEEINQFGDYQLSYHYNGLESLKQKDTVPYKHSDFNPYVEAFWQWWPELYYSLDTFRITGGEPLLSKDTWGVLDYIIEAENPNTNLKLSINSNLGVPDDLIDKLIQKLEVIINEGRVKEVILFTSCDAYGKQAEYVRFGLEFNRLMSNIDKILLLLPKVTIVVMSTFNIFSIFSYEKLISKIYDLKLQHFNTERYWNSAIILDTSYLRFPDFLSFRLLKDYLDVEYFNRCEKFMKFHSTYRSLNFYEQQTIEDVGFSTKEIEKITRIKEMFISDSEFPGDMFSNYKKDFLSFIKQYETRRGVKCEDYYPELVEFIKQIENYES
jgi:hypothetical protein